MSEHSPATTSKTGGEPVEQTEPSSVQVLAEKAIEPASQAGEYVARNVHEYPLTTVLAAALNRRWHWLLASYKLVADISSEEKAAAKSG